MMMLLLQLSRQPSEDKPFRKCMNLIQLIRSPRCWLPHGDRKRGPLQRVRDHPPRSPVRSERHTGEQRRGRAVLHPPEGKHQQVGHTEPVWISEFQTRI